jgi:hypothetical protein
MSVVLFLFSLFLLAVSVFLTVKTGIIILTAYL